MKTTKTIHHLRGGGAVNEIHPALIVIEILGPTEEANVTVIESRDQIETVTGREDIGLHHLRRIMMKADIHHHPAG